VVTDAARVDRGAWTRLVEEHPRGTAFQRPEMYDVYAATRGDEPVLAAALRPDGSLAGVMLGVLQRSLPGALGALTARVVVWGGPVVRGDDPACVEALLGGHAAALGGRAVYTQFRNLWDVGAWNAAFRAHGYAYEEHLDILVDLTQDEGAMLKAMKHFRRKNVKRAEREGLAFREIEARADLDRAHAYIRELYRRIRLPVPHASYFEALRDVLRPAGLVRYFGAYDGDRLVAARLVLAHGEWMYDFWAGADESQAEKQGNTALPWAIFRWGAAHGYRVFDFGGAGKPGVPYGVREYKLAYGGELVGYGRWTCVHRPLVYRAGVAAVGLLRATRRGRKGGA
jgi:lipid II:glycine glycyltransferase (peptidoglycan interpeptide bridge formation enzyme)